MTSVKEIRVETPATADGLGRGAFTFTDAYSVFDWGRMPDSIPDKGASLCAMGAYTFERLEAAGVPTHYRGLVDGDRVVGLDDVEAPPREMAVDLATVPELPHDGGDEPDPSATTTPSRGGYDYDAFHAAAGDYYLVPLEIVFRNTVPVGSSLRGRSEPADYDVPFDEWPDDAVPLEEPIIEFSTKFEEQDRYLDPDEADRIAGRASIDALERIARRVNESITDRAASVGLTHQDGKIECLYADGEIRVADVAGTLDENRFSYDGQQLSKEVLRQYYKRVHPEWVEAVARAKREADRRGVADWRPLCEVDPPSLPADAIAVARDLYTAGADAYLGRDLFEAPSLDAAVAQIREL